MEGNSAPGVTDTSKKIDEGNSSFNLKWLISTIMVIWPWLLGCIIVSLVAGNLYLRYAIPVYKSTAELLLIDSKKSNSTSYNDDMMQMLRMDNNKINIDNEIEILKSRTT